MTKNGNSAQKLAARRVQNVLGLRYTEALRLVTMAKVDGCNWGQAADAVILEHAGEGLPITPQEWTHTEPEGDAE
jgi:urease gamma subunit